MTEISIFWKLNRDGRCICVSSQQMAGVSHDFGVLDEFCYIRAEVAFSPQKVYVNRTDFQ